MKPVASPCVNICTMDAVSTDGAICVGCFRTLDEIAQWSRASNDARIAILTAVERRRAELGPGSADMHDSGGR
jgi:predicted Fe-S protein YdhL (DUF1289 family)